ncbi:hypothetical protein PENSPDRAFT_254588 [Peniophora sp. CONT]|nr:hypothetical protein PENSPDRAFT_254588 [Peniophora sp. CONT]
MKVRPGRTNQVLPVTQLCGAASITFDCLNVNMAVNPLAIIEDTGVPAGAERTHKTLVLIHGLAFQSTVFTRMLPYARTHSARIILVNRRGYPGAEPFTRDERDVLSKAQGGDALAAGAAKDWWTVRAEEVLSLLESIVEKGDVPPRSIILAGWSYAGLWMTALLSLPPQHTTGRVDVGQYVRRVICYDSSYRRLGLPEPAIPMFSPFTDISIAPEDKRAAFIHWITGYYSHAIPHAPAIHASSIVSGLEQRHPNTNTPLNTDELNFVMFNPPADVPTGGADILASSAAGKHGLPHMYLEGALRGECWPHVELRAVWGDASFWEACVGGVGFGRLVQEDKETLMGKISRPASAVRWIGANHFAHWDYPERTLLGLLEDGEGDWTVTS